MGKYIILTTTLVINSSIKEDKSSKLFNLVGSNYVDKPCLPKDQDGLGILNSDLMNISLQANWLWKFFNEDCM
jgi:hypothetical protein